MSWLSSATFTDCYFESDMPRRPDPKDKNIAAGFEMADDELARVATLTDAEVLRITKNGSLGPGIVGKELFERAQRIIGQPPVTRFGRPVAGGWLKVEQEKAAKAAADRLERKAARDAADKARLTEPRKRRRISLTDE